MKKITKISALLAALLMFLCFVSCKQNASSGPSLVASFKGAMTSSEGPMEGTLSFYGDSSVKLTAENGGFTSGTYTGDVTKDGSGTISFKDSNMDLDWELSGNTLKLNIGPLTLGTFEKQ